MHQITSPDPALTRNRDGFRQLGINMCLALPPPQDASPQALARRDNAAIAMVAALLPVSVAEAALAVQHVVAALLALEAMRRSQDPELPASHVMRLYSQSGSLMRQSQTTLRALERMQAGRTQRDDTGEGERSNWIEHCAAAFMRGTDLPPLPQAVAAPPPPLEQQPAEPPDDPAMAAAEDYATQYPDRAALIRHLGHVPDNVSFGPPADDIVLALVIGDTPVLRQVDAMMAPRIQDGSLLRAGTCQEKRNFETTMGLASQAAP